MNKIVSCIICSLLGCFVAKSQSTIVLDVSNLKDNNGVCRACLFTNKESFEGKASKPFECIETTVKSNNAHLQFNNISSGTYAVFVYHDENGNNKMDRNFLGIPREGYGASKNNLPLASAPTFNDNKFFISNKTIVRLPVKIRNLLN